MDFGQNDFEWIGKNKQRLDTGAFSRPANIGPQDVP